MIRRPWTFIILGACLVLCACASGPLEHIAMDIDAPRSVAEGGQFEVRIAVNNSGSRPVPLDSMDMDNTWLQGIQVLRISPAPEYGPFEVPVDQSVSYRFDADIPAQGRIDIVLSCLAQKQGSPEGDISVCISNWQCKSMHITTGITADR